MKHSLGYQVLFAIAAGIFAGIFFGPVCSIFKPAADIFSMLLQMVALPYIAFSLMHGLGSIEPEMAKKIFKKGWVYLVALWALVFACIYLLGILIPNPLSGWIAQGAQEESFSNKFLDYIIPGNPIYDFANNIVPAIATFGVIIGAAIMHLEEKEPLLGFLERLNNAMEKIFLWLTIVSPIGVFAHIAVAVGTVNFQDLYQLEFYVLFIIIGTLFLTFWILPVLLSCLTSMKYGEIIEEFRNVCLLAFATGLPSIAFPFINRCVRRLATKHEIYSKHFQGAAQTVVPIGFSFAQIGNCFIILFIFFISFYYRHPFGFSDKFLLNFLTIPMSFGSNVLSYNAVSFLVSQLNFPKEAFSLFFETSAITLNFQVLLSVASVFTCVILVLYAYYGLLVFQWKKLIFHLASAFAVFTALVLIAKPFVKLGDNYAGLYEKLELPEGVENLAQAKVYRMKDQIPPPVPTKTGDPLERILKTGILRVGYDIRNIPYAYLNEEGKLVGYDIAYAYKLASDLNCKLALIPIDLPHLTDQLERGDFDIAMSAIIMTEERLAHMDFTRTYSLQNNVLVVALDKRADYLDLKLLEKNSQFRVAAMGAFKQVMQRHFPLAQQIDIHNMEALEEGEVDAIISARVPAFIWTLNHPKFCVIEYGNLLGSRYFSYPVKTGSEEWLSFLNNWLDLKQQSGFKQMQYDYWIDGIPYGPPAPRWNILDNVLENFESE